jgi:hypothetical protein
VVAGGPGRAERRTELVVDEVAELVQEAERDPAVPSRDAQVDGIGFSQPVAAGLARGRGGANWNRLQVGVEEMQRIRRSERPCKLGVERAASRQSQKLR